MQTKLTTPINKAQDLILAIWDANEVPCLIGEPGIGKTDVSGDAARALAVLRYGPEGAAKLPFFARSWATMTSEDIVMPDRDPSGAILHKPVGAFRVACERPAVILGDELNRCQHSTQNASLTLFHGGLLGDYKLHAESRLIAAMNDVNEEGGDGAHDLIPALADRLVFVYVEATFDGWFDYATTRIGAEGTSLRALALDYAFSADRSRRLVSLHAEHGVDKRPSPRAIRKGLGVYDACLRAGLDEDAAKTALSGCIGVETAGAFLAIRKIRKDLPDHKTIKADPHNAKLPESTDIAWAASGLLGAVATEAPDPAWIYLGRFKGDLAEVQLATARMLRRGAKPPTSNAAMAVSNGLLGMEGLARAGQPIPGVTPFGP